MLWAGLSAYCQDETELCKQAQTAYQQNHFAEAIKLSGRALTKNPGATCRRTRIEAAMQEATSVNYLMAISDLEYLIRNGDMLESTFKMLGNAESGLAKIHFENKNYQEAAKHFQKGKESFVRAQAINKSPEYETAIANAENGARQSLEMSKK